MIRNVMKLQEEGEEWGENKEVVAVVLYLPFERVIKILHEEGESLEIRNVFRRCQRL